MVAHARDWQVVWQRPHLQQVQPSHAASSDSCTQRRLSCGLPRPAAERCWLQAEAQGGRRLLRQVDPWPLDAAGGAALLELLEDLRA